MVVSSTITTAMASGGRGAPVVIRATSPDLIAGASLGEA